MFSLSCLRCAHTRIPNHKDSYCLRNNNTFCRFFPPKNKVFMIWSNKRDARGAVRAEIAKLTTDEKSSLSSLIFSRIAEMKEVKKASVIAVFISLSDEPQTATFIEQISPHKRVVVPRIEGEEMEFYDISEGVAVGSFGIMEPLSATPVEPSEIDVMIVPGVAFTRNGSRCGRGKGFYDKYLSRRGFRAYTIGVCYPCQLADTLPVEEHDKILDCVVSV